MEVTRDLVLYLEKLARIELSEGERETTQRDLQDILTYMNTLGELDTNGVEPLSHAFPVANVTREDIVAASREPAQVLANAPNRKGNCFRVPKTVE
ncbi:MAG: Asp-tRNA(Asn)/Glu-tRNA(Gln) amidotransferase subunit GatC [Oscillospiraceae bacterium]|jgi:aspartyl-tRNA(Asn)/glutamyl-tRNA(Gln) amidotransferase subunit C|nr:Asp-tRNA(Asn)/Glu-tRNA(Gln) amidotransferase subunit GatC [Oscillospiraceae bacterium]